MDTESAQLAQFWHIMTEITHPQVIWSFIISYNQTGLQLNDVSMYEDLTNLRYRTLYKNPIYKQHIVL